MSVYRPAKSPYFQYDFVFKGRRYHGSTGQQTRLKAERVEVAKKESAGLAWARERDGEAPKVRKAVPTLDAAAGEWWAFKGQGLGTPADEVDRLRRLQAAVKYVGAALLVTEIRIDHVAKAIQKRRGHLVRGKKVPANATVNREVIDTIRPVLRRAYKLLEAGSPPIDWGEVRLAEPKPKPRDFTAGQLSEVYDALPIWWRDFARFQARYGCRLAEMFFTLDDIDLGSKGFKGARVLLRDRKGDDDHHLPILADDAAMLAARVGRATAAGIDTPWFRELKAGKLKPIKYGGAQHALGRAMRASGLHAKRGAKGAHDLRHHAAMQFLRTTKSLRGTQKLLGHADIKSTLVYAHVLEDDLRAGLEDVSRNSTEPRARQKNTVVRKQRLKG